MGALWRRLRAWVAEVLAADEAPAPGKPTK